MNTPITRLHILDQDSPADRINVTVSRIARNFGAFHDASAYFGLFPLLAELGEDQVGLLVVLEGLAGTLERLLRREPLEELLDDK